MPFDIKESLETISSGSKNSSLALDNLQIRLMKAKSIQHEINLLKSSPDYLSSDKIRKEEISVEIKIIKSNKIKLQIEELEADPALMSDEIEYFYQDMSNRMSTLERKNLPPVFDGEKENDFDHEYDFHSFFLG